MISTAALTLTTIVLSIVFIPLILGQICFIGIKKFKTLPKLIRQFLIISLITSITIIISIYLLYFKQHLGLLIFISLYFIFLLGIIITFSVLRWKYRSKEEVEEEMEDKIVYEEKITNLKQIKDEHQIRRKKLDIYKQKEEKKLLNLKYQNKKELEEDLKSEENKLDYNLKLEKLKITHKLEKTKQKLLKQEKEQEILRLKNELKQKENSSKTLKKPTNSPSKTLKKSKKTPSKVKKTKKNSKKTK